ncbi:M15 family metallopeptidase [bacterium]|nr:M15 family metallopeptidase [bacterium]
MKNILNILVSFFASLLTFFNVLDLPQDEDIEKSDEVVVNELLNTEESSIEDLEPEEVVAPSTSSSNWWEYPSDIQECTRDGNNLLVLVNKKYQLPSTYKPTDLVKASNSGIRKGENYYLRSIIIDDLRDLITDSKNDGIDLSIVSGYRSYNTQESTYNYWISYYNNCVSCTDKVSARAGHSQHQLGTTLDFSSNEIGDALGSQFGGTKASNWLVENAYKYGFVIGYPQGYESTTGYSYESWHYRYIGKSNALEQRSSGMILEMYLRSKN